MAGERHGLPFRAVRGLWLRLAGRADLVLANSQAGLDYHRRLGLAETAATRLLPNGIDTDRFRPDPEARRRTRAALGIAPDRPVVINVARVDPMKDHPGLLAAMKSPARGHCCCWSAGAPRRSARRRACWGWASGATCPNCSPPPTSSCAHRPMARGSRTPWPRAWPPGCPRWRPMSATRA
jgi:hypothetical protein